MAKNDSVAVDVTQLVKAYGDVQAVRSVTFKVNHGTTATLLGPSGCGKTTTLRCIAGLEVPTAGRIKIGDRVAYDGARGTFVEPERRNIGMVFQSYAIWPHMTVGGNVAFPLRIRKTPRNDVPEMVDSILSLVGLAEFKDRSAAELSGGQQQRVALARALVHRPRLVLFDEPLSNLDANLRERMRTELQLLQAQLGFTAIYVTHDQEEAMALSDHIIVMNQGTIEQQGTPREVFAKPATAFTARFLGYSNALEGRVVGTDDGNVVTVECADGTMLRASWSHDSTVRPGMRVIVAFRADCVTVNKQLSDADANTFRGKVESAAFLGTYIDFTIVVGGLRIKAATGIDIAAARGSDVPVSVAVKHCHAFFAATDSQQAEA